MKQFNKHKAGASVGNDKVAKGIAGFILKLNSGFAKCMNECTAKLSSSTMKVALIVFLSFGTSLSFYFIVAAFVKEEPSKSIEFDRISMPRNFEQSGDERVQHGFLITKEEYKEMKRFVHYMDSLQKSKSAIYDSITLNRPGMMDSVKELEQFYEQQNK